MKDGKHAFALFFENASALIGSLEHATINDKELLFRLSKVLRAQPGDELTLFDQDYFYMCCIEKITTQSIVLNRCEKIKIQPLLPCVAYYLPLLEREAFEDAVTSLTVMGVSDIYPIITEKSRRSFGSDKELDRVHRLMVAASEQSKQFGLPTIHPTQKLTELAIQDGQKIFFDAQGSAAYEVFEKLKHQKTKMLCCMIGPEGDLTESEKQFLRQQDFHFVALTPTILRASTAVCVSAGLIRSLL